MKSIYLQLFLAACFIGLTSCGEEKVKEINVSKIDKFIASFEETGDRKYADSLIAYVISNEEYLHHKPEKVETSIRVGASAYLRETVRKLFTEYMLAKDESERADAILFIGDVHQNDLMDHNTAHFLYLNFVEEYPNDPRWDSIHQKIPKQFTNSEELIAEAGRSIYGDNGMILSRVTANRFMQYAEIYALCKPDNPNSADYLFQAAEVAKSLELYNRSLYNTRWVIDRFPEHEMAAKALFLKAFTYDDSDLNQSRAIELYGEFVYRFPEHPFAESARLLKEKASLSDEQILKRIRSGFAE